MFYLSPRLSSTTTLTAQTFPNFHTHAHNFLCIHRCACVVSWGGVSLLPLVRRVSWSSQCLHLPTSAWNIFRLDISPFELSLLSSVNITPAALMGKSASSVGKTVSHLNWPCGAQRLATQARNSCGHGNHKVGQPTEALPQMAPVTVVKPSPGNQEEDQSTSDTAGLPYISSTLQDSLIVGQGIAFCSTLLTSTMTKVLGERSSDLLAAEYRCREQLSFCAFSTLNSLLDLFKSVTPHPAASAHATQEICQDESKDRAAILNAHHCQLQEICAAGERWFISNDVVKFTFSNVGVHIHT